MIQPWTIESYVSWKQPHILRLIWLLWQPVEDDPEFRRLDRIMRQKPRPGRAGALRGEEY